MSYRLELNGILDKCNLSKEERIAFEKFMDGKVYAEKDTYPDCDVNLSELVKNNQHWIPSRKKSTNRNNG